MRSSLVAREISTAAVADAAQPRVWEFDAPQSEQADRSDRSDQTPPGEDDLRSARGIFAAVVVGGIAWVGIGWGAFVLIDRIWG